jgi:hypothetical protein
MAFVPHLRFSGDLLGISPSPPRRVLLGLVVALASRLVPGDVVEKILLLTLFAGAFAGAARLVAEAGAGRVPQLAAGALYAWNPLVYERLALGQLAFLLGYAALPWVAAQAVEVRRGRRRAVPVLVLAAFAAAVTGPYGGGFALAVAAFILFAPRGLPGSLPARSLAMAGAVAVNLPWIVPALVSSGPISSEVAIRAFSARSDSPLGLVGSLLSLGGLWRTDLAPPGRDTVAWIPVFLTIAGLAFWGWPRLRRSLPPGVAPALVSLAVVGVLAAGGPQFPGTGTAYRLAAEHIRGGGALRDSQKFLAPYALLLAVCFGMGVSALRERVPVEARPWRAGTAALAGLPLALVPALAFGLSGRLFTTQYPPSWQAARQVMAADPRPGAVLVLPWHLYLPFAWNRDRTVIDPALAYFTRTAVASDALEVGLARIPPEDPYSARADPIVRSGKPGLLTDAAGLGFRYVLLLHEADWQSFPARLATVPGRSEVALEEPELTLYRIDHPAPGPVLPSPAPAPILAGDVIALVSMVVNGGAMIRFRRAIRPQA